MSIEPGDSSPDALAIPDIDLLISSCAGIVEMDKESRVIRFVHKTFQEYIANVPPVPRPIAQCDITQTCLTYLLFDVFANGRCESDEHMNKRLSENPFFWYAAKNWGKHARGHGETDAATRYLIERLLAGQGPRQSCLQGLLLGPYRYDGYSQTTPKVAPGLWLASYFGLKFSGDLLLSRGSHVDEEASDGSTALQVAAKMGFVNMIDLLLDYGASLSGGSYEAIPLLEASRLENTEAANLLLERGADINAKTRSGRTALHEAASNSQDVALFMIARGIDVFAATQSSLWTAMHAAVAKGSDMLVSQLLLRQAPVDARTSEGESALHIAAGRGHYSLVILLIDAGSDVKWLDVKGNTPLHLAAEHGFEKTCLALITRGSDVNWQNIDDEVPLHKAAMGGHIAVVNILQSVKADPNIPDSEGALPLHRAAWDGHISIVNTLLDGGCDVNSTDNRGRTCLHGAAAGGHLDLVRLLLQHGADRTLTCGTEANILWKALNKYREDPGRRRLFECMIGGTAKCPERVTAQHEALQNSQTEVAKLLSNTSVVSQDPAGLTMGNGEPIALPESIDKLITTPISEDCRNRGVMKRLKKELGDITRSPPRDSSYYALPIADDLVSFIPH
jgi:ankyrin repeat protein